MNQDSNCIEVLATVNGVQEKVLFLEPEKTRLIYSILGVKPSFQGGKGCYSINDGEYPPVYSLDDLFMVIPRIIEVQPHGKCWLNISWEPDNRNERVRVSYCGKIEGIRSTYLTTSDTNTVEAIYKMLKKLNKLGII